MTKKSGTVKTDFSIPTSHYESFRAEFITLLCQDLDDFAHFYMWESFESKLLDPAYADSPLVRRKRAIDKWLAQEVTNSATNQRLYLQEDNDPITLTGGEVLTTAGKALAIVRRLILDCLGPLDWDELEGSFSNGASTGVKRGAGVVPKKYQVGCDITAGCIPVFTRLNRSAVWFPELRLVDGNEMFTVPKSTTIDRVACKEPDLNMYCQKAVGDLIRRKLRQKGVNLNDQSVNQRLAREGSITGDLATIDLSSASDSVTTQLVIALLPFEWSSLILDVRSPYTRIDGELHENEMISSMGNACTFELESLIFWAITKTACILTRARGRVSVYGDDIIAPSRAADALFALLRYYGFTPNERKTYVTGPFRESCGKHYLEGADVSPFYVRAVPKNVSDWIHLLNSLRLWLTRRSLVDVMVDDGFALLWKKYAALVPKPLHGGWDYQRRDILVAPGRPPIARIAPKQGRASALERQYQDGAYLQWLDTAEKREFEVGISNDAEALITSEFTVTGKLAWERCGRSPWSRPIPWFLSEIEAMIP